MKIQNIYKNHVATSYAMLHLNYGIISLQLLRQNQKLSSSIAERLKAKYLRDNIKVYHHQQHNRRFRHSYRKRHKERKLNHQENERKMKESIRATCPDQNAINLSTQELSVGEKFLLRKGPSFVPNPTDINWQNLKRDFDNFANKLIMPIIIMPLKQQQKCQFLITNI